MATKHLLQGLARWHMREPWQERFQIVLDCHMMPASSGTGVNLDDIPRILGEDVFYDTAWISAFEDFLTKEFENGSNIVDEYLKRRGWKESASVRSYMAALRRSVMSVYEVSDIVSNKSFRLRDLVRGGEPILISEAAGTGWLEPSDRIATRVLDLRQDTQISGTILLFEPDTSDALLDALRRLENLDQSESYDFDDEFRTAFGDVLHPDMTQTERLRVLSPVITTFWLVDQLEPDDDGDLPDLRNSDGDEVVICTARYPFAAGVTYGDIETALNRCPELRPSDEGFWKWAAASTLGAAPDKLDPAALEARLDDGALVIGGVELEDRTLFFTTSSLARLDSGRAMLMPVLESLVGQPVIETETVEEMMAARMKRQLIGGDAT